MHYALWRRCVFCPPPPPPWWARASQCWRPGVGGLVIVDVAEAGIFIRRKIFWNRIYSTALHIGEPFLFVATAEQRSGPGKVRLNSSSFARHENTAPCCAVCSVYVQSSAAFSSLAKPEEISRSLSGAPLFPIVTDHIAEAGVCPAAVRPVLIASPAALTAAHPAPPRPLYDR